MNVGIGRLGLLIIGDPISLAGLAEAEQLDLLLGYRHIVIPDETAYEAARRFAASHALDYPDRLQRWITEQLAAGRVSCPTTWLGELAAKQRSEGSQREFDDLGLLVGIHYMVNLDEAADRGPVTFLADAAFVSRRPDNPNVQHVDTRLLLTALGHPVD